MRLLAAVAGFLLVPASSVACVMPLGPLAGIVKYEYDSDRSRCHKKAPNKRRCTIESDVQIDGAPVTVTTFASVRWRNGVLYGDFAGASISPWQYRWKCATSRS